GSLILWSIGNGSFEQRLELGVGAAELHEPVGDVTLFGEVLRPRDELHARRNAEELLADHAVALTAAPVMVLDQQHILATEQLVPPSAPATRAVGGGDSHELVLVGEDRVPLAFTDQDRLCS